MVNKRDQSVLRRCIRYKQHNRTAHRKTGIYRCFWQMRDTEATWGLASSSSRETTRWSRLALLRVWNWAAVLHMFSLQSRQQKFAGCFLSQASHSCEPLLLFPASKGLFSLVFGKTCCLGVVSFTMSSNAKFFDRPWTPVEAATEFLHLGQSMVLPWSNLFKQLEQKLCPQLSIRGHLFSSS